MLRLLIFLALFTFHLKSIAQWQDSLHIDTIQISANSIVQSPKFQHINQSEFNNLQEAIFKKTAAYARNYAPGQSSTLHVLGANAVQTNITWKGINISNPMLGLMDLSIIPVRFFNNSQLNYMPSKTNIGIGGNLELISTFIQDGTNISYQVNSLGNHDIYGFWAKTLSNQKHRIQFIQNIHQNHYKVDLPGYVYEMNYANQIASNAFYEGEFLTKNWKINTDLWASTSKRNIAASFGGNANNENQIDNNLRSNIAISKVANTFSFSQQCSYLYDEIYFYSDFLDDHGIAHSFISSSNLIHRISSFIQLENRLQIRRSFGSHPNYKTDASSMLQADFSHLWKYENNVISIMSGFNGLYNQIFRNQWRINPVFNMSMKFQEFSTIIQTIKASRYPTLNDLNWNPGGNPNLLPEDALKVGFGLKWNIENYFLQAFVFHRNTKNQIQWIPNEFFWGPENISKVNTTGFHFTAGQKLRTKGDWKITLDESYYFTRSINKTNGVYFNKELIYIPKHKLALLIQAKHKRLAISLDNQWLSKRYTNFDNSLFLKPFFMQDLMVNFVIWNRSKCQINTNLAVKNLTNAVYQHQAGFFQPGRNAEVGVILKLK